MSRVIVRVRCNTCGGNIMDDPLDERTYCLQCGRGIDRIKNPYYAAVDVVERGREYHSQPAGTDYPRSKLVSIPYNRQ